MSTGKISLSIETIIRMGMMIRIGAILRLDAAQVEVFVANLCAVMHEIDITSAVRVLSMTTIILNPTFIRVRMYRQRTDQLAIFVITVIRMLMLCGTAINAISIYQTIAAVRMLFKFANLRAISSITGISVCMFRLAAVIVGLLNQAAEHVGMFGHTTVRISDGILITISSVRMFCISTVVRGNQQTCIAVNVFNLAAAVAAFLTTFIRMGMCLRIAVIYRCSETAFGMNMLFQQAGQVAISVITSFVMRVGILAAISFAINSIEAFCIIDRHF